MIKKQRVTIETKEGRRIEGRVDKIDRKMNSRLTDCTVDMRKGKRAHVDTLAIRGSSIRYLVFSDSFETGVFKKDARPKIKQKKKEGH